MFPDWVHNIIHAVDIVAIVMLFRVVYKKNRVISDLVHERIKGNDLNLGNYGVSVVSGPSFGASSAGGQGPHPLRMGAVVVGPEDAIHVYDPKTLFDLRQMTSEELAKWVASNRIK